MAKALVKSPGRKTATRTTGTRAARPKSKPSPKAKAAPRKATKQKAAAEPKSKPTPAKAKPKAPRKGATDPKPARGSRPAAERGQAEAKTSDPRGQLKERFAKLSQAKSQISGLKRSIHKSFFDVGVILNQIRDERLYEVKGYGSFESFVEREIDLNKAICLRSARIAVAIKRDEAEAAGLERASAAVAALDGEEPQSSGFRPVGSPVGTIPVHKR